MTQHPAYRAQFYIQELKKYVTWPEYLSYYKERDNEIMQFNNFCLQQWTEYVERKKENQEEPMSYKVYLERYRNSFKRFYGVWDNARPED